MKKPLIDLLFSDPNVSGKDKVLVVLQLQAQGLLSPDDARALILGCACDDELCARCHV